MWLFVLFLAIPLIEIALFIQVGGMIGLWSTLAIVILTAFLGTWLVRNQGALAMNNLRSSFSRLDDPTEPLAHGAMILVAGALLLTPGFFTDALGFALLMPPIRNTVIAYLRKRVTLRNFQMGQAGQQAGFTHPPRQNPEDTVIDGDFHEIDPSKTPTHGPSGWTKH